MIRDGIGRLFRTAAFPARLLRRDEAALFEALDRIVNRATGDPDDLVVAPFFHLRFHLIGMHRMLHQQVHDRQRQRRPG